MANPRRQRPRRPRRSVPAAIRITHAGAIYLALIFVVATAATNTGNNTLFMVLAVMLSLLVVSGLASRQNVRGLQVELDTPAELYANRPFRLDVTVLHRASLLPRWFLLVTPQLAAADAAAKAAPEAHRGHSWVIPVLPRRGQQHCQLPWVIHRRGHHRLRGVRITSLFPFGLFQKGELYPGNHQLLVYPQLFEAARRPDEGASDTGSDSRRRVGWGYDLYQLRAFRPGDDPRSIHWKQSARTGELVYKEREAERGRRIAVLFDNGTGKLSDEDHQQRFEMLVSEAATAVVQYLQLGYEVELVTRDHRVPFANGPRQRHAALETLALVQPAPRHRAPLEASDPRALHLRLGLQRGTEPEAAEAVEEEARAAWS